MKIKFVVIFFLIGKSLFSQSFDENFLLLNYQKNNNIQKIEEETFDDWNIISVFNEEGFLLHQTNYKKKERKSDYKYEYTISDSLITIRRTNKVNNEINKNSIEKYYYSSLGQCSKFEIYSSTNLDPFYFADNFVYSDGLLLRWEENNIFHKKKNGSPIKKVYRYNEKKQKIQELRIVDATDTTYYSFLYNQYGQLTDCVQESKDAIYSGVICWSNSAMNKVHIRYIDFDKYGNWTKSYFVTENGMKFRSKRKIKYLKNFYK